eukprot:505016-Prorocentrum_minimum.AAC.1
MGLRGVARCARTLVIDDTGTTKQSAVRRVLLSPLQHGGKATARARHGRVVSANIRVRVAFSSGAVAS